MTSFLISDTKSDIMSTQQKYIYEKDNRVFVDGDILRNQQRVVAKGKTTPNKLAILMNAHKLTGKFCQEKEKEKE